MIGLLVSSLPAVQFGDLYYRRLEINKITALRQNQGDFDAVMNLSEHSKGELLWWINNITQSQRLLLTSNPDLILTTDASLLGWGAVLNGMKTGGHWSAEEQGFHINYLEMKAVLLGLKSLCPNAHDTHICVQSDNTTTVTYINAMGGIKTETCNDMALQIWEWCIARQIWLSARHIPGSQNIQADRASRAFKDSIEWSLSKEVFQSILSHWGPFHMDMFASRLNHKVKDYVAWRPDPGAAFIDAFCVNWEPYFFYAFLPFSLIPRCLTKIENDQATGVLIVPYWTTQSWFTPLSNLLVDNPLLPPQSDKLLLLPHTGKQHPLRKKMRLMACKLSGQASCREVFLTKQPKSCIPGQMLPSSNTSLTSKPGSSCAVNGRLILMIDL